MKSTTVVSLTKIAQMLTSRIGRKPLLLALAATMACLRTATAMDAETDVTSGGPKSVVTPGSPSNPVTPDGHVLRLGDTGSGATARAQTSKDGQAPPFSKLAATLHELNNWTPSKREHIRNKKNELEQKLKALPVDGDQEIQARDRAEINAELVDLMTEQDKLKRHEKWQSNRKHKLAAATLATTTGAFGIGMMLKTVQQAAEISGNANVAAGNYFAMVGFSVLLLFGILAMFFFMFNKPGQSSTALVVGLSAVGVGATTMIVGILMGTTDIAVGEHGGAKHVGDLIVNPKAADQLASAWIIFGGFMLIIVAVLFFAVMQGWKGDDWKIKAGKTLGNVALAAGPMMLVAFGGVSGHIIAKCTSDGFAEKSLKDGGLDLSIALLAVTSFLGLLALAHLLFSDDKKFNFKNPSMYAGCFLAVASSTCVTVGFSDWMSMGKAAADGLPELSTIMFIIAGAGLLLMGLMFAWKVLGKKCLPGLHNKFFA